MSKLFLGLSLIVLCSCSEEPIAISRTNNPAINLQLLFENDGCKVYRFYDDRAVYYTDCRGEVQSQHIKPAGKAIIIKNR
jgi:hypothetical protein